MANKRRNAKKRDASLELTQIFPEVPRPELTEAEQEKLRQVLEEIVRLDEKTDSM